MKWTEKCYKAIQEQLNYFEKLITLKWIDQYWLIFAYDSRHGLKFVSLQVSTQLFPRDLLIRLSFLHCIAFALFSKIKWLNKCGSTCGCSALFHWFVCLKKKLDYSDWSSFMTSTEIWESKFSVFVLFYEYYFEYSLSFAFPHEF